jgi:hypothetical protein
MDNSIRKKLAYDLALEFIKENTSFKGKDNDIIILTDRFSQYYESFYKAIGDNEKLKSLF